MAAGCYESNTFDWSQHFSTFHQESSAAVFFLVYTAPQDHERMAVSFIAASNWLSYIVQRKQVDSSRLKRCCAQILPDLISWQNQKACDCISRLANQNATWNDAFINVTFLFSLSVTGTTFSAFATFSLKYFQNAPKLQLKLWAKVHFLVFGSSRHHSIDTFLHWLRTCKS